MGTSMKIKTHSHGGSIVRTVTGVEGSNSLLYVAYDVARALDFSDTETAVCAHCHDVVMQAHVSSTHPKRLISLIGIEDVRRLIAKAVEHKAWAFEHFLSDRLELRGEIPHSGIEPSIVLETTIHNFMGMRVRTVQVEKSNENNDFMGRLPDGSPNETYFVAKDVATTLGYADADQSIRKNCKHTKKAKILSGGKTREVSIIKQSDVFRLVMRSKLPQAEAFQDWVVEEVLPSIQKTGFYKTDQTTKEVPSKIDLLKDHIITENARLLLEADNKVLKEQALLDAPKVEFHDGVATLSGDVSVREAAQTLGTGLVRLMSWLRENKWVCGNNVPMQDKINAGFITSNVSSYEHPDLGLSDRVVTRVTSKGLIELSKHKIP